MWVVGAIARKSEASGWRGGLLIGAVVVLAALLAGASWSAHTTAVQRDAAEYWRVHTLEVLLTTDRVKIATLQAMRGERGYLLTGDEAFLAPYITGARDTRAGAIRLARLTGDNPAQQQRIARVRAEAEDFLDRMQSIAALERRGRHAAAIARVKAGEGRRSIESIHSDLAAMRRVEQDLLAKREAAAHASARAHEFYQYGLSLVGVLLLAACVWAAFAVRRAVLAESALRRELRRHAMFDELTGLANRREFLAGLAREVAGAERSGRPLAVAMLDIDHFKRVNDTWGHAAGDAVIRRIAELARETMRGNDLVGRLGGEEFAIAMPESTPGEALQAAERLRLRVLEEAIPIGDGRTISVTASTGISRHVKGATADTLLARADEALYRAKNAGRDRVLLAA